MKSILKITLALVFLFPLVSCSDDDGKEPQKAEKLSVDKFISLGHTHNEGLDYIYSELVKVKNRDNKLDETNVTPEFFVEKSKEYILNSDKVKPYLSSKIKSRIDEGLKERMLTYSKGKGLSIEEKKEKLYKKVTPKQKKYIEKVFELVFKNNISINDFHSEVKSIMNQIIDDKNLSNKEKKVLLLFSAVEYHSFEYWTKYNKKWGDLFNSSNSMNSKGNLIAYGSFGNIYWDQVVFDDGGGFLDGAEAGAAMDPFGGEVPGALIGALGCSGFSAFTQY